MLKKFLSVGAAIFGLVGTASAAHLGFALDNRGEVLYYFSASSPETTTPVTLSGDANRIDAIDFHPVTNEMIGFDSTTDQFYKINPFTGNTKLISDGMLSGIPQSNNLDVDFNPTINKMRLVTANDDNVVFDPATGTTTVVTDIAYNAGDPNFGVNPAIIGNGYTNSFAGATTTTQYAIDAGTDSLVTLDNNAGTLNTIAQLTLNGNNVFFGTNGGLDIFWDAGNQRNIAYASIFTNGAMTLFIIDLVTAELTEVGDYDASLGQLKGLAFAVVDPVPLPAAMPLFVAGLGGIVAMRRRRKKANA